MLLLHYYFYYCYRYYKWYMVYTVYILYPIGFAKCSQYQSRKAPKMNFCWPGDGREPGPHGYIARDSENLGYLRCSAYLNYIGGNMQYLPIKFTKAIYL